MKKQLYFLLIILGVVHGIYAQNIDIENLSDIPKAKPFAFGGSISANGIFYNGTNAARNPFTYFLQGSANVSIYQQIDLPFTFSITNQGTNYSYPTLPNRFSLHPTYKGYTLHLGEVNMSYSPYTLSGIPFFGVGADAKLEQTTGIPLSISLIYGRLQKAVEYNLETPEILPAYKRMGYGGKIVFEKSKYRLGLTLFGATDYQNSLDFKPDSMFIFPKQNLVIGLDGSIEIIKNLRVNIEYAASAMTQDIRDNNENTGGGNYLKYVYKPGGYTDYKNAFKSGLSYSFFKTTLSIDYERIDPTYQTLGTYYSNQDLERVSVNATQTFWKDKITITGSFGYEHDNLDGSKDENNKHFAYSLGGNMNFSERFQANANYSNFTSNANIRSQFEDINNMSIIPIIDTINYMQTSQNATLSVNYLLSKSETQNQRLSANFSFQDAYNHNDGSQEMSTSSQFYNAGANYALAFPKKNMTFSMAYNMSYSVMPQNENITMGPTLSANYSPIKSLTTGLCVGYNTTLMNGEKQNDIWNIRFNASYKLLKHHNFNFNLLNQFRNTVSASATNDVTVTIGYAFTFK